MSFLQLRKTQRAIVAIGAGAVLAIACNDTPSAPVPQATTLYVYADYANPNVTVSVNGVALGQITKQYTSSNQCGTLITKNNLDGVYSFTARLGQKYSITWKYSSGATDSDSLTIDSNLVGFECLLEAIEAP